jgi:hypothetical protein
MRTISPLSLRWCQQLVHPHSQLDTPLGGRRCCFGTHRFAIELKNGYEPLVD